MRNIKTKLRQTRNTALLLTAVSGLFYMSSCSSDVNYNGGQDVPETPVENGSYTVYGANPNRIRNFGNEGTRAAADDGFTMPDNVSLPSDAESVVGKFGWEISNVKDKPVFVPAGAEYSEMFNVNTDLYIAGTLNMLNGFGGITAGKNVYILPGGTLNLGSYLQPGFTIYNYGTLETPYGFGIGAGVKVYSAEDLVINGDVTVNGAENGNDAGLLYCKGSITTTGNMQINGKSSACAYISSGLITFNAAGTIYTSYIKGDEVVFNSGNVVLNNNGLIDVNTLNVSNEHTRFTVEEKGTNAVVVTKTYNTNNHTWLKTTFAKEIAVDFEVCNAENNATYSKEECELLVSDRNQVFYVPSVDCHGEFGTKPDASKPGITEDEEKYTAIEIVKLAEIDKFDDLAHDHGVISATCINFGADGTAYASYHLRGQGSKGCIEVIKDNGSSLSLGSYMIAPEYDFNHIIVDGNRIVAVGNNTKGEDFKQGKGAFVGSLPTDFEASTGVRNDFTVKQLTTDEKIYGTEASTVRPGEMQAIGYKGAGDGNCIVKYGDKFYFTSYAGYGVLNDDFSKVPGTFVSTNGSAKHIALGSNKMAIIAHDTYDKTSSPASVYTFGLPNGTFGDVLASYNAIGTIEPVDGKNVVALDGDDIYACLSHGGLARIRGGQVTTKTFGMGEADATYEGVPINGLAIDSKYIYVAGGSFVYVLEKESMEEICHYHATKEKSANYIALNNGKIYVAYGEDGIMAFQLEEKEIEK